MVLRRDSGIRHRAIRFENIALLAFLVPLTLKN